MGRVKLFSPGPVMVSERVRNSLLHYDICHRGSEFMELFVDIQQKIKKLFKAGEDYYPVIISGSGTSANECVFSSVLKPGESILLVSNGTFGERLEEIIVKYNIPFHKVAFEWGKYPEVSKIEETLKSYADIKYVAMVYHETSSGMINPVEEIGKLAKKYGKLFYVDAVSAAAGQNIDVNKEHIDIITSVGGKALGAFPGSAYICAKEEILAQLNEGQCKNVYLNLYKHYYYAKNFSQTPNTPNVNLFFALNEALTELLESGLDNKIKRYKECASILRKGLKEIGLEFILEDKYMSNTVTSVLLPKNIDLVEFINTMETLGYVIYEGKGIFKQMNMFQVANMGEVYPEDCYEFLKVLADVIITLNKNS